MRFLLMIILLAGCVAGDKPEPSINPDVADGLERLIERHGARSIAVGLRDNGRTGFRSFGQRTRDDLQAPAADTVFEIGSISKVFTSLLTQVQVDAGRLDWDDTLGERLPDIEFSSAAVAAITLRELATHTMANTAIDTFARRAG